MVWSACLLAACRTPVCWLLTKWSRSGPHDEGLLRPPFTSILCIPLTHRFTRSATKSTETRSCWMTPQLFKDCFKLGSFWNRIEGHWRTVYCPMSSFYCMLRCLQLDLQKREWTKKSFLSNERNQLKWTVTRKLRPAFLFWLSCRLVSDKSITRVIQGNISITYYNTLG